MALTMRPAAPGDDAKAIFEMLLGMFDEGRMLPLAPPAAGAEIERVCREEAAWMVHDDERLVGSAGLAAASLWFTEAPVMVTRWFYALPDYRSGAVFNLMRDEIADFVEETGVCAFLDLHNPIRGRKRAAVFSRQELFEPRGVRVLMEPTRTEEAA